MFEALSTRLLNWYASNGRQMPWRNHPSPYTTWVSEIMLQQTRFETVIPYFERWMKKFPDLTALADASQEDVLRVWEGLGYYGRARNLHKAAQLVVDQYNGEIPGERTLLEKLPGIGRYTAGAIASIAFGRDEAVLDGNVRRVLSRIFDVSLPARSKEAEQLFWELSEKLIPPGQAGDFNQAMMDLGAMICTPKTPVCNRCPIAELCKARLLGNQAERPVMGSQIAIPHHIVTAAVIQKAGSVLIARRPPNGLLGGLWEFPGGKQEPEEDLKTCLQREILEELGVKIQVGEAFGVYKHAYTHFKVTLHAFLCSLTGQEPNALEASEIRWVFPEELSRFPMGKIDRQIALRIQNDLS